MVLLPEEAQRRVRRQREGQAPHALRERAQRAYFEVQAGMMVVRTVAIDEAIVAAHHPQLVILGAGLDGRAWRMRELSAVSVFEVDHPDSQRDKRERVSKLSPASCDIRFVPVDFERDELEHALTAAGHDASRPTTWVWEGVVMYLRPSDIEATLAVIRRRSAKGSRLIVVYHSPALVLKVVGLLLRRVGEPLRSAFKPEAMRALLERHGLRVIADHSLAEGRNEISAEVMALARRVKHQRIALAELF